MKCTFQSINEIKKDNEDLSSFKQKVFPKNETPLVRSPMILRQQSIGQPNLSFMLLSDEVEKKSSQSSDSQRIELMTENSDTLNIHFHQKHSELLNPNSRLLANPSSLSRTQSMVS